MPNFHITAPDGKTYEVTGPEGSTAEQALAQVQQVHQPAASQDAPSAQTLALRKVVADREAKGTEPSASNPAPTFLGGVARDSGNLLAGAVRGAGSIGATLLASPQDLHDDVFGRQRTLSDIVGDKAAPLVGSQQRRADMDAALAAMGADPKSDFFKAGKLGGEIAGTAGAGGAITKVGGAVAPDLAARVPGLMSAIGSSGMTTGKTGGNLLANLAARSAGGAITGGASAGLVNPENAVKGAEVGAALPLVIAGFGKAGQVAADKWRAMHVSGDIAGAQALAKALDAASPAQQTEILNKLRSAETLVPGASPTVAQALQSPEASILQRVVYDSPGGGALRAKIAQQGEARLNALESVAPTVANGAATARQDLGAAIASRVIPEEKAVSKLVSAQYRSVDPNGAEVIQLPVNKLQGAVDKYMGAGTFGANTDAATAVKSAQRLSAPTGEDALNPLLLGPAKQRLATWDEVAGLRGSINQAMRTAQLSGDRQAVAALTAQKSAIDEAINSGLSPEAKSAWLEANASHAAKMDRFHTGPQASIFRTGPNGEPAVQGGEIASKFWGARPGAADDVKAFRKLVDDNPAMLGQFKSMVTTEGAGTADAAGNLTTKFSKWVEQNLPGLREAFKPEEVDSMQRIAADIDRSYEATKAGTSLGGSNTYQNASNALGLGLLDSPALNRAANMVPGLKYATGPALEGVKGYARNAKAQNLAALLSNSDTAANAIEKLISAGVPKADVNEITRLIGATAYRSLPVAASR